MGDVLVRGGINRVVVEAGAEYGDRAQAGFQRGFVGNTVDAESKAGDEGDGVAAQTRNDCLAGFTPVGRVLAGADDAEQFSTATHAALDISMQ